MSIMARRQVRSMIEYRDASLTDISEVDNISVLDEMDRSISSMLNIIDAENNVLLSSSVS